MPDTETLAAALHDLADDPVLVEAVRRAIEARLMEMRDARTSAPSGGNGLVIRERDGTDSSIIRIPTRQAVAMALREAALALEAIEPVRVPERLTVDACGDRPVNNDARDGRLRPLGGGDWALCLEVDASDVSVHPVGHALAVPVTAVEADALREWSR